MMGTIAKRLMTVVAPPSQRFSAASGNSTPTPIR